MRPPRPCHLAESLQHARKERGLSQAALARSAGIARGTVHNLEAGLTTASPATISRLQKVVSLEGSSVAEHGAPTRSAGLWFSSRYNPMQMSVDMVIALNGPGGTLEQTLAYLDSQSATDWFEVSNQPAYRERVRAEIPVLGLAKSIARTVNETGLDLIGLGAGDGKSETRLAEALVRLLPKAMLHCYLLDISHPLLIVAFKHASAALPREVPIFLIHGNFLDRVDLAPEVQAGRDRRRLWTMFGNTFGNLAHEPSFLKDVGACANRGDLLLLDVSLCWAPAHDLQEVRRRDPALQQDPPESVLRWLSGPFKRHCKALRDVRIELSITNRCPLPGSYEGVYTARVNTVDGTRNFDMFRARRYDLGLLGRELADLGWQPRHSETYGPAPGHALLLLERQ